MRATTHLLQLVVGIAGIELAGAGCMEGCSATHEPRIARQAECVSCHERRVDVRARSAAGR